MNRSPRADFRLPGGRPLPLSLRAVRRLAAGGGSLTRRAMLKAMAWRCGGRLPEMVVSYSDGRRFALPAGDLMYGPLLITGEWEPNESRIVDAVLGAGDFAIDVGANHGWFTLLMASRVGRQGLVLGVEPCPPLWQALARNLELNDRPEQIQVRQLALCPEPGSVTINLFRGLEHGHASMSRLGREDNEAFEVPADTLDAVVGSLTTRDPVLIKLDVEGAERGVLAGGPETLAKAPIVLLEVNDETSRAFGYEPADLLSDLDARLEDQTVFRVERRGLRRERSPESAPHGTAWLVVPAPRIDRVAPFRLD